MPATYRIRQQTTSPHNIRTFFNELTETQKKAQETIYLLGSLLSVPTNKIRLTALLLPEPHELHAEEMECQYPPFSIDHGTVR
jgi:hypothetical protein